MLMNIKNGYIYSDKFSLRVVDLTQISLATEEDKTYRIDYWARLFKSRTWEELKMIAQRDENMMKAAEDLYTMNGDETIRAQCRARADYYRMQNTINQKIKQLTADKEQLTADKEQLTAENEQLTASISEKDREIALLKKQLAERASSSGYAEDI
jgi:uncharacterized protein (DUF3084 family)